MMKNRILFLLIFVLSFYSCKYELVSAPTREANKTKTSNTLLPPENIIVSNGKKGVIELSWENIQGATSYKIYTKDSRSDDFYFKDETKQNSISLTYSSGTTQYFAITSINYLENESNLSKTIMGSTLATPIITEIQSSKAGVFNVKWWMDNCSENTYQDKIEYIINAYSDINSQKEIASFNASGENTNIEISLLGDEFYFTVEARLLDSEQQGEKSEKTNAKSAKKIAPNKVENFTISNGLSTNYVMLNFDLPDGANKKTQSSYDKYPVYFELYRRALNSPTTDYTLIDTIGSLPQESWTKKNNAQIHFNCQTNTVTKNNSSCDYVFVQSSSLVSLNEPFTSYIPKSTITYLDKTVERGIKYEYYIKSCTDNTTVDYSDETSLSEIMQGCKTPKVNLKLNQNNHSENGVINVVDVDCNLMFESPEEYDNTYDYVLTSKKTDLVSLNSQSEQFEYFAKTYKDFNKTLYLNPQTDSGYFDYYLYILSEQEHELNSIPTEYIEKTSGTFRITVTQSEDDLPKITDLSIQDGFSNKFIISWEDENCQNNIYKLSWTDLDTNQVEQLDITPNITSNTHCTFEHTGISDGVLRTYSLIVKNPNTNIETQEIYEQEVCTLGKANIEFNNVDYNNIVVSWKKVRGSNENYEVRANYKGTAQELTNSSNTTIEYDEETQTYTCTITKPSGYNDINKAGADIDLTVISQSNNQPSQKQNSTKVVRLLGPALIQTNIPSKPSKKQIEFAWTKIPEADKYFVYRIMYNGNSNNIKASDSFIIDSKTMEVFEINGQSTENRTTCSYDSVNAQFVLLDKQADSEEIAGYQINQARIQTGNPFRYFVFPLKNDTSIENCPIIFTENSINFSSSSTVQFTNLTTSSNNTKKASTFGYGVNVHAQKAQDDAKILVTWEKPNSIEEIKPVLYIKRFAQGQEKVPQNWEPFITLPSDSTSFTHNLSKENEHFAYFYAIEYQKGDKSDLSLSYLDEISIDDDSYTFPNNVREPKNKGYAYNIGNFIPQITNSSIGSSDYFTETINFADSWNIQERALKPDSFTIELKNKNFSNAQWNSLAQVIINSNGQFSVNLIEQNASNDITLSNPTDNTLFVKPTSLVNNTSNESTGLLKVLRDTKHYYSLSINYSDKTVRQAADERVYTYRQITPTELAKCINVILADALYQTGIPTKETATHGEATNTLTGANGSFTIGHYGSIYFWDPANSSWWGFDSTNYQHIFTSGLPSDNSEFTSDFSLYSTTYTDDAEGIKNYTLYHLSEREISVSHPSNLSSYNVQYKLSIGQAGTKTVHSILVKINNETIININNNQTEFLKYFPYLMGEKREDAITTYNSSLPLYKSPWWN